MYTTPSDKPRIPHKTGITVTREGLIPINRPIIVLDCNGTRRLVKDDSLLDSGQLLVGLS